MKRKTAAAAVLIVSLCLTLAGCGQTGNTDSSEPNTSSTEQAIVSEGNSTTASDTAERSSQQSHADEPAAAENDVLLDNEYVTIKYLDTTLDTSLHSLPEGFPAYRVSIKNKTDKRLIVKATYPSVNGDDKRITASVQNADGQWDASGLIMEPGQELTTHIGITRYGTAKQFQVSDMKNVDLTLLLYIASDSGQRIGFIGQFPFHIN